MVIRATTGKRRSPPETPGRAGFPLKSQRFRRHRLGGGSALAFYVAS
ncbi:hypothetical protein BIWAKO_03842 [Bosea sp. BIWAKO-01]|nr:hypothetical protein BIWAKO_03842 [Bosea sp. BIWAKO-01]